jgi:hypothetical protein
MRLLAASKKRTKLARMARLVPQAVLYSPAAMRNVVRAELPRQSDAARGV